MPTYSVHFRTYVSHVVRVDMPEGTPVAEIEAAASEGINPNIGHQANIDLGDWEPISFDSPALTGEPSVYDEDGEPVTDPED